MERLAVESEKIAGLGFANGTFGELLQGCLRGHEAHFMITLPIHRFSKVTFELEPWHTALEITPTHKHKAVALAKRLLHHLGMPERGQLRIESDLAEGKGMASSSADLVATARAIYDACKLPVDEETLLAILRDLEPTDGVMYPEFVVFFHRRVQLQRRLGLPERPLRILAIDEGGTVDTLTYNRNISGYSDEACTAYQILLEEACAAFARSDLRELGRIATKSTELNQVRNPKQYLDQLRALGEASDALGVVTAHSGPRLGLLFEDSTAQVPAMEEAARELRTWGFEVLDFSTLEPALAPSFMPPPSPSQIQLEAAE